ncbi:MAG: hypothetical protein K0S39_3278, partial [Paenibacillus sp.]|nr:hypothetical protein [Paenibacillus sp.]
MKNKMVILSVILAASLLTACGNTSSKEKVNGTNHGSAHGTEQGQANKTENKNNSGASENHHSGGHGDTQHAQPDNLRAAFVLPNGKANANEDTELSIQITDDKGNPVKQFTETHEKLLHLIVVDHDLGFFNHIHPDYKGDGKFTIKTRFPAGGKYKLFADFAPTGGSTVTKSEWVNVEGKAGEHAALEPDTKMVKQVAGKEIELQLSGLKPNQDVNLNFNIRDAQSKQGIQDLEQYLGAVGHVVIISQDANEYLHVHPLEEKAKGPDAKFATSFPKNGLYKIWGQFQHK